MFGVTYLRKHFDFFHILGSKLSVRNSEINPGNQERFVPKKSQERAGEAAEGMFFLGKIWGKGGYDSEEVMRFEPDGSCAATAASVCLQL